MQPSLSSVVTVDTNGDGYIDRLVLTFDESVDETSIVSGNFGVNVGSITAIEDHGSAGDSVIRINLTDGSHHSDVMPVLTITAAGIKDLAGNGNALVSGHASTDGAAPVIHYAGGQVTTLTVRFSEPVYTTAVGNDLVSADFTYSDVSSSDASDISAMINGVAADEQVELSVDVAFNASDFGTDTIAANASEIFDASGNAAPTTAMAIVASDTTPPTISLRETADLDGDGYLDAVHITFDESIKDSTVAAADFAVSGVASNLPFNSTAGGDSADDADIYITFNSTLLTDAAPTIQYIAGSLTDLSGNALVNDGPTAVTDKAGPAAISAVAGDGVNTFVGIDNDDTVIITFSEATNEPLINAGNIGTALSLNNSHSWLDGLAAIGGTSWNTPSILEITLSAATGLPTVALGDTVTLDGAVITDLSANPATPAAFSSIGGTFSDDTTPPTIASLTTADTNSDGYIDQLMATFSENVNAASINVGSFSTPYITTVEDNGAPNDDVIIVKLTDGKLKTDSVPSLSIAVGGIKDIPGNDNSLVSNFASVDTAGPAIISAVASDGSNILVGLDADDTVNITFSEATNKPAIDETNINAILVLNNSHTWRDGANLIGGATWNLAGDLLTITLSVASGDPSVAPLDTITLDGTTIQDAAAAPNNSVAVPFSSILGTYSADTNPPALSTVVTADTNGDGYVDRLIVTFDENVNDGTINAAGFTVSAGTKDSVVDDGTANDAVVHVNLADGAVTTGETPLLSIAANSIYDLPGNGNAGIVDFAAADGAAPIINTRETADLDNDGYTDAVHIIFNEAVLDSSVTVSNFAIAGASNPTFSPTAGGDTPDDTDIYIVFDDGLLATDITPDVGYTAGTFTDANGTALATATAVSATDKAAPVLMKRETADTDGDGFIDAFHIELSEPVLDATVAVIDFTLALVTTPVFSPLAEGDTADDADFYITFVDGLLATDVTPNVGYTAGTIADTNANALATTLAAAATDKASPVITARGTADLNGSGYIDAIHISFSEAIDDATVNPSAFAIAGASNLSFSSTTGGDAADDADIYITFDDGALSSGAVPNLSYIAGSLADLNANFLASNGPVAPVDLSDPVIIGRETADLDGNGYIDAIHIVFSESIDDGTVTTANFGIAGVTNPAFAPAAGGDTTDDADIYITFDDDVLTSSATPDVGYTAGTLNDLAGNALATTGAGAATDKAGPAVLSALASDETNVYVGVDSDDTVTVTFSEPTDKSTIDGTNIDTVLALNGGHRWRDGNNLIASAVWDGTGAILTVSLSVGAGAPTAAVGDTIAIDGTVIHDVSVGNNATAVPFSAIAGTFSDDTTPPGMASIVTGDVDGDGFVDQLLVTFTEAVDESTLSAPSFSTDIGTIAGVVGYGTATDTQILINLVDGELYSDGIPALSVAAGGISDLPGNNNGNIVGFASTDGAPPVLLSATSLTGLTALTVRFSEAVDTSNAGGGNLVAADFIYVDVSVSGATSIASMFEGDGTNKEVTLSVDSTFVAGDIGTDTVAAVAGAIFDLADNAALTGSVALDPSDTTQPTITSRQTRDLDGDGYIDAMRIIFDEAILESTVTLANFSISGVTGASFSSNTAGDVADDSDIYITFDDGALDSSQTPTVQYTAGTLTDLSNNFLQSTVAITSTDKAGPAIVTATASDPVIIQVGIDIDDTVTFFFSENTNQPAINSGNINSVLALGGGHTWLDGASAVVSANWTDAKTLRVELAVNTPLPTIAVGDSVTTDGTTITDLSANPSSTAPFTLGGSFSDDLTPPAISGATTADSDGDGYVDRLVVSFVEAVDFSTVNQAKFSTNIGSVTSVTDDGAPQNTVIYVELADGVLTSDATPAITIDAGAIQDLPDNYNLQINNFASTDGAGPAIISAAASDGAGVLVGIDGDDTVTITFSENTNKAGIGFGNINSTLVLGNTHSWLNDGGIISSASWNIAGNVLTIGLTDGAPTDPTVAVGDTITLGGGTVTDGTNPASTAPFSAIGGTFSDDTTPPALSSVVTADTDADGFIDRFVVVFEEAVDYATIVLGNFSVSAGTGLLTADNGDTTDATIWLNIDDGTLASDVTPQVSITAGGIEDLPGNTNGLISGFASTDGAAPVVSVRETADLDGDGYLDGVHISFSEAVVDTSVASGDFDVAGVPNEAFSGTTGGDTADDGDIYITFDDGVLATDATPTVTYTAGTLTDIVGNALLSTGAVAPTDAAGPAVISAVASDETNIFVGVDNDDTVTITFSEATTKGTIDAGNIDTVLALNNGHTWLDGGTAIGSAVWNGAGSVLTVTLSKATSDPTIAVGDTITLTGAVVTDGTNTASGAVFSAFTGTFSADLTPPTLQSLLTQDTDQDGYIDRLAVTFDEPVDETTINAGNFSVNIGTKATVVDDGNTGNAIIWVNLTDGELTTDVAPRLSVLSGGISDVPGNASSAFSNYPSVDRAGPVILSAIASDKTNHFVGIDDDDTVTITFSEPTNKLSITSANVDSVLTLNNGHIWRDGAGSISSAIWNLDGDVLLIQLSVSASLPTVAVGDTITVDGAAITDASASLNAAGGAAFSAIGPTFSADVTQPSMASILTADTDGDGYVDRLITTFDEPVDEGTIVPAAFTTDLGTVVDVTDDGTTGDAVIWVDLQDGALTTGQTPRLSIAAGGIEDAPGNQNALISDVISADGAGPAIISAVPDDATNIFVGIDDDDAVTITFSEATNKFAVNSGNIDSILALNNTHSWLDGAGTIGSAVWDVDGDVLTIVLSVATNVPTVAVGDTITLGGSAITDGGANQASTASFSSITGSFSGDQISPTVSTVVTADTNGDGYIDQLAVTFSEPVDENTINIDRYLPDAGTVVAVTDDGNPGDAVILVILTDGVLTTDSTPLLTIGVGGIEDKPGNVNSLISDFASTDGAGPAIISAVASDASAVFVGIDNDDTVTVTFSEATNQPVINAAGIDTVLPLNNGHSWLDVSGAITQAVWNGTGDALVVTLSNNGGEPTVAVGDTISTDGATITDGASTASVVPFSDITGTFSADTTGPVLSSVVTADANSDGYIDRLVVTFNEAVNELSIVRDGFSTDIGSISAAGDDGVSWDKTIWVDLLDGELATDALPALTIAAQGVYDVPGNPVLETVSFQSTDGAAPAVLSSRAIYGEKSVHIVFSEDVSTGSQALSPAQFSYSDVDNPIANVVHVDLDGIWTTEIYLLLSSPLDADAIFLPHTLSPVSGAIFDRTAANSVATIPFEVTDVVLSVVEPVWASDNSGGGSETGGGSSAVRRFDGTEKLPPLDIQLQVYNPTPYEVNLVYEVEPLPSLEIQSVGSKPPENMQALAASSAILIGVQNNLYTFYLPLSEIHDGGRINFMFILGDMEAKRLVNPKDPSAVSLWSFVVQPIVRQRGGVTILTNKINPDLGEQTRIIYSVERAGSVSIVVTDLKGDIIDSLKRESQEPGEYQFTWDGRNRGERKVAPGLYFIKVVGPDINEIRKVLVIRQRR